MIFLYKILTFIALGVIFTIIFWFLAKEKHISGRERTQQLLDSIEVILVLTLIFGGVATFFIQETYDDGIYCAEIHYYNPETGTNSQYFLSVSVKDGKLSKIHWPNGGWLDDSHFKAPKIWDGTASFTTDRDYEYEVEILNQDSTCE